MKPVLILALALTYTSCASQKAETIVKSFYEIQVETITGETIPLENFRGKVLLIVNTASKCGLTGQYEGLQALYEKYKDHGLIILGFPSNDFLRQEPGTNVEIQTFCKLNYGVTFPMFAKITVKGQDQHPLYRFLTDKETNPKHSGKITWNFNKFLIGRNGDILNRFSSRTKPQDPKLLNALEASLALETSS